MRSFFELAESALQARDSRAQASSERVIRHAKVIAQQMNYSPADDVAWTSLERGVRLRDLGNIGVPDTVLMKPGALTASEVAKMREHTTIGSGLFGEVTLLSPEHVIVRSHHERYDGKGYPDGKKGDELSMDVWIVSAANAIDAMTSDRPYRKAMTLDAALEQVREGAGTQFHPDVAQAVLDASKNGSLKLIPDESL